MELLDLLCMWGMDRNETGGDVAVNSINSSQYSAALFYTSMFLYCWNSQICNGVVKINSRAGHFISSFYMWHCHVKRSRLCSRLFMSGTLSLWQHINLPPQPRMPREASAETNDDPGSSTSAERLLRAAAEAMKPERCTSATLFFRAKDQVTVSLRTEVNREAMEILTSADFRWSHF